MVQDMPSEAIENPLSVNKAVEGDQTVVEVTGEVDAASADILRNAIFEVIDGGQSRVIVDMTDVSFMDSSGLRVLIAGYKGAEQAGGALHVRNPSDVVTRLLEITGQLDRFVPNK
ncbi:MAG: anti-sigma factor antagonist [Actinomycetota bacterium]|jgi:anti-anti-sigma factor